MAAAVTFQNISEIGTSDSNNFQFELFFDGTIRITYLRIDATNSLAGLSQGLGIPPDFVEESDLDVYGPCSCGNGALQAGEQCDDGNNANGDGCSASCHVEVCFQCAGEPSQCTPLSDDTSCDDGQFCNGTDRCDGTGGRSVHSGDPCAGGAVCNQTCNEAQGRDAVDPAGTPCPDGNACNGQETCQSGTCTAGPPLDCTDYTSTVDALTLAWLAASAMGSTPSS